MRYILCLCLLAACNFAPKYTKTDLPIPEGWRTAWDEIGDTLDNALWWESLGDTVLNGYVQEALENNKDLKIAMARVQEYLGQYHIVRSSLFPQLSGAGAALKEKLPVNQDFMALGRNAITPEYGLNLSLSYEIDFWGKVRNATTAAYSQYLAQIENRKTVVLTLVGSVVQAYILLRQLDLQLEIAYKILKSREESLKIARYRFEGGLTSEIEVAQALSVYGEALAVVNDLERRVPQQENLLSVLLGKAPDTIPRGLQLAALSIPKAIPVGSPEELLIRRPDIMQAENNLRAAYANIGVARAAFFPSLTFDALYGVESLSIHKLLKKSSTTWILGGGLLQQIFTGGALVGQLHVAKAQQQELLFSYEQTILNALREVDDSMIGFEKSKQIFLADSTEVFALEEYLQLAWARYYEGQNQYLTVLDAERKVFTAQLQLAEAQADQFLTLVNLYKALGGGWVSQADSQATTSSSD